jgi:hypothetical protein
MPARLRPARAAIVASLAPALLLVAGCAAFTPQEPQRTPTDFAGLVAELARVGVGVTNVVSGDAGCPDQRLARTAIAFDAVGPGGTEPTRVFLYRFRDMAVYEELRPFVDLCARSFVVDPADYATVDAPPWVLAGPGPWDDEFERALQQALERAVAGG